MFSSTSWLPTQTPRLHRRGQHHGKNAAWPKTNSQGNGHRALGCMVAELIPTEGSKEGQYHSILHLKTLKSLEIVQTLPRALLETRPEQIFYRQSAIITTCFAVPETKARFPVTSIRGYQVRLQQPGEFSSSVITAQELTETIWLRLIWKRGEEQKNKLYFSAISSLLIGIKNTFQALLQINTGIHDEATTKILLSPTASQLPIFRSSE